MTAHMMWKMKLNETKIVNSFGITRVPGGWIYRPLYGSNPTAVFVPLDNEFVSAQEES